MIRMFLQFSMAQLWSAEHVCLMPKLGLVIIIKLGRRMMAGLVIIVIHLGVMILAVVKPRLMIVIVQRGVRILVMIQPGRTRVIVMMKRLVIEIRGRGLVEIFQRPVNRLFLLFLPAPLMRGSEGRMLNDRRRQLGRKLMSCSDCQYCGQSADLIGCLHISVQPNKSQSWKFLFRCRKLTLQLNWANESSGLHCYWLN